MTEEKDKAEAKRELWALVAAAIVLVIGIALAVKLPKVVPDTDSARIVALLLIPALVYGMVSGRLTELTGPFGWGAKLARIEKRQDDQQEEINRLVTAMSPSTFRHLAGIYILKKYEYAAGDLVQREFYYLKDHGFIGPATLEFDEGLRDKNIGTDASREYRVEPTELGLSCLKLRKKDILKIDDKDIKWLDTSNENMKKNINFAAVRELGLKVTMIPECHPIISAE